MIEDIRKCLLDADFDLEPDDENTNEIIVNLVHLKIVFSIDTYYGYYFYCLKSIDNIKQFTDEINIGGFNLINNVLEVAIYMRRMESHIIEKTTNSLGK